MAQGDLMQLGVAYPLPNYSFSSGQRVDSTLSSDYTSGADIFINAPTPGLVQIFQENDIIHLGPSTHANSAGAYETATVDSVTSAKIVVKAALSNDFASGDPIWGIGSILADGWTPSTYMYPIGLADNGYRSKYGQKLYCIAYDAYIQYALNNPILLSDTYYRAGLVYKTIGIDAGEELELLVNDGSSSFIDEVIASANQGSWTEWASSPAQSGSAPADSGYFRVFMDCAGNAFTALIDWVFLEHASGTDDTPSGVYTFDDRPVQGSVKYRQRGHFQGRTLADGTMIWFDPTGLGAAEKWMFSCRFENVPKTFLEQLLILKWWQDKGNLLAFHPYTDVVPPVLIGRMTILEDTDAEELFWDKDYVSFSFVFIES